MESAIDFKSVKGCKRFFLILGMHLSILAEKISSALVVFIGIILLYVIGKITNFESLEGIVDSMRDSGPVLFFICLLAIFGIFCPGIAIKDFNGEKNILRRFAIAGKSAFERFVAKTVMLLLDASLIYLSALIGSVLVISISNNGPWMPTMELFKIIFSIAIIPIVTASIHFVLYDDPAGIPSCVVKLLCFSPLISIVFNRLILFLIHFTRDNWWMVLSLYAVVIFILYFIGLRERAKRSTSGGVQGT